MAMIPHKKLLLQLQCSPARYAIKATLCKWKSSCKALSAWPAVEQQTLACISALTHAEQNYAELRRAMQNHAELSRTMKTASSIATCLITSELHQEQVCQAGLAVVSEHGTAHYWQCKGAMHITA